MVRPEVLLMVQAQSGMLQTGRDSVANPFNTSAHHELTAEELEARIDRIRLEKKKSMENKIKDFDKNKAKFE